MEGFEHHPCFYVSSSQQDLQNQVSYLVSFDICSTYFSARHLGDSQLFFFFGGKMSQLMDMVVIIVNIYIVFTIYLAHFAYINLLTIHSSNNGCHEVEYYLFSEYGAKIIGMGCVHLLCVCGWAGERECGREEERQEEEREERGT